MINNLKDTKPIEILKSCIGKKIQDIFVTGWSEGRGGVQYFSTMDWWYYIQFEDLLICLSSNRTTGILEADFRQKIEQNFEVEDSDTFTIMRVNPINQCPYEGWKVVGINLYFGKYYPYAIAAVSFECKDFHEIDRFLFFEAMTLDGIEVGGKINKNLFLEDERHYFEKLI